MPFPEREGALYLPPMRFEPKGPPCQGFFSLGVELSQVFLDVGPHCGAAGLLTGAGNSVIGSRKLRTTHGSGQ